MNFFSQFDKTQLLAAHRGFRALYPENTLLAFKKALNKCDFIEFDVQFTQDDIPIVIHDNKLLRTTNAKQIKGFKKPYYVWDYGFKALQQLDISSWFYEMDPFFQQERLKHPKRIEHIKSLEQIIIFAKKHQIPINIEIKYKDSHPLNSAQLTSIVDLIKQYEYTSKTLVSSFCHDYLQTIKTIEPSISTAALAHQKYPNDLITYLKELKVDAYHINERLATKKLIKELIKHNIIVNVYTINDKIKQEKLFGYGVRTIFTDFL